MIEKVQIAAIVLGSLFLVASISWLIWSSLSPSAKWQRQDLLFQICYGMYGFMDVVCIGEGISPPYLFKMSFLLTHLSSMSTPSNFRPTLSIVDMLRGSFGACTYPPIFLLLLFLL